MMTKALRAALYARVSTTEQTTENQLIELHRYAEARGWTITEYLDEGISGTKERRPALDRLMSDARRRRFDVLVVWRLDRLGRNLKHLITTLDGLTALGIAFTSLNEGIDGTTPAGKLQMHIWEPSRNLNAPGSSNGSEPVLREPRGRASGLDGGRRRSRMTSWRMWRACHNAKQPRYSTCRGQSCNAREWPETVSETHRLSPLVLLTFRTPRMWPAKTCFRASVRRCERCSTAGSNHP
jgi:hypothetical protein